MNDEQTSVRTEDKRPVCFGERGSWRRLPACGDCRFEDLCYTIAYVREDSSAEIGKSIVSTLHDTSILKDACDLQAATNSTVESTTDKGRNTVRQVQTRIRKVSHKASFYKFPLLSQGEDPSWRASSRELIDALHEMNGRIDSSTGQLVSYAEIRGLACDISIHLNERSEVAPRFRALRKSRPADKYWTDDDTNLSNDRQIVDLHWLYITKSKISTAHLGFRRLFEGPEFDFDLAGELVTTVGSVANKIESLGIGETKQIELAALQTKSIADLWRATTKGGAKIRMQLEDKARSRQQIQAVDDRVTLWKCIRLCGESPTAVTHLFSLMTGRQLDRSVISRKIAGLHRALSR